MNTTKSVEDLLDAAEAAYRAHVTDARAAASLDRLFGALDRPVTIRDTTAGRLPACAWLGQVAGSALDDGALGQLMQSFLKLEPHLAWYKRTGDTTRANAAYHDGHANAMIVGPGGLVRHGRAMLGVSLLAPGVRYPDHTHPPEETYLVLSDGEFSQDGETWFTPGIGGTFYNPPGILHAMRSGEVPLFAMWALWAGEGD